MDKRVIIAAGLSVLVLLLWQYILPTAKPPAQTETTETTAQEMVAPAPAPQEPAAASTGPDDADAEPTPSSNLVEATAVEELEVSNGVLQVRMTNEGGRAVSWRLRDYVTSDGEPLEVVQPAVDGPSLMLAVDLDDRELTQRINRALFQVERSTVPARDDRARGTRLSFRWSDGLGLEVEKNLTFRDEDYLVDIQLDVIDRGRRLPARMTLGPGFGAQEPKKGGGTYHYDGQALWNAAGQVERKNRKKVAGDQRSFTAALRWAGLEDQYFSALLIPSDSQSDVRLASVERTPPPGADETSEPRPESLVSVSIPSEGALLYVGAKKFTLLRELGHDLEQAVWFSSNGFLAWIAKSIFRGLLWINGHTVPNFGVSIIIATFLLRLLLFPVNQYAMVSMKKTQLQMAKLQPKMKGIRSKYKKSKDIESRNKMNQELMELYKQEGVNPAGGISGCLPILAQFPILIGFYNMLTVAVELRGEPFFGWITDLSRKDPAFVIPLAMGATMFLQQKLALSKVKDPAQLQQQRIMMVMPLVFTFICINMPSGMVLYWFVNNVLGIGQQWIVNRKTSRLEAVQQKA